MRKLKRYLVMLCLVAACKKPEPPPEPISTGPSEETVAKAKAVFAQRCVPCHGASGAGDGAASATLDPKPRNYTDATWQASVDDTFIEKIIKLGGVGVGKSAAMPNNPDLSAEVITSLKDIVRGFNPKKK